MTSTYGLTTIGLLIKTLEDIRDELETTVQGTFGPEMKLGDKTILGQLIGIIAEREAALWDLMQLVYASQDPDSATGSALDAIASLTGTIRPSASYSTVTLTLAGVPGTVVLAGASASVAGVTKFLTIANSPTFVTVASWLSGSTYAINDIITNIGNVYRCTVAGTSTVAPTSTTDSDTGLSGPPGSAKFRFVGVGTASAKVTARAAVTGPQEGRAGTITTRDTPSAGWNGVTNLLDAALGRAIATDEELRLLRSSELALVGTSTQDAIRAALLEVPGVTAATVFVNSSDVTNTDGVPPHAIEALVQQSDPAFGADQAIRDCLFENVAAGIATYAGSTPPITGTSTDSQGVTHEIDFSRPQLIPIYVTAFVLKDSLNYPLDGDAQVLSAILAYGNAQITGKDVVVSALASRPFQVAGVLDVLLMMAYPDVITLPIGNWATSTVYSATVGARSTIVTTDGRRYICSQAGTSASSGTGPVGTGTGIVDGTAKWDFLGATIPVSLRQLATFDSTRITVLSSSGTP